MKKNNWWVILISCTLIFNLISSLIYINTADASPTKGTAEVSLTKIGTFSLRNYSVADKYSALQGSTIVGNSLYVTCNSTKKSETALLMEIDLNTFKLIRSAELPLYHANNVTYNPNYNGKAVLLIPHTIADSANPRTVSIVDLKTLTILENKTLSKYVDNLSYDQTKDIYVGADPANIHIFDGQFKFVKSYRLQDTKHTTQGSEVYNNSIIEAYSKHNSLFQYNDSGKMVKEYSISDDYGELESCISLGKGDVVLGFNNWKSKKIFLDFYKVNLDTMAKESVNIMQ